MQFDTDHLDFNLHLAVKVRKAVPNGALLEARFDNLADPTSPFMASAIVDDSKPKGRQLLLQAPSTRDLRCGNYTVVVTIYRDPRAREPLGTHTQQIQCPMDSREWHSLEDWIHRLGGPDHQVCPSSP